MKEEAEKELAEFYPKDSDGATPIAYLWARTIRCEGPGCGAEVPLIRSLQLVKKKNRSVMLRVVPNPKEKRIEIEILQNAGHCQNTPGIIRNGSATCPVCGYTTPNVRVRSQLSERCGGTADARLFAVVTIRPGEQGRHYRPPTDYDIKAANAAADELLRRQSGTSNGISLVPDEPIPTERPSPNARGLSAVTRIGVRRFGDLFTARQALVLSTYSRLICELVKKLEYETDKELSIATATILALSLDKIVDMNNAFCVWQQHAEIPAHLFARQAVPIIWDRSSVAERYHSFTQEVSV